MSSDWSTLGADELHARTRAWLAEHLPDGWMTAIDEGDVDAWRTARAALDVGSWWVAFGESGLATPTWPAEYGAGLSLAPSQVGPVNEVLDLYRVVRPTNIIGIGMGGPTVLAWGSEQLKHRLLRGIATNEEIWCQLFSEPGAGSDVAGLATRAEPDGDEWVLNGQKVWTSFAHLARFGLLVARSDPDQPKHRGLTYFVIDMHQQGVEVRPLRQLTGDAEFNEVFLHDARVPDSWRLGAVGDGWRVAITTLMNERISLSGPGSVTGEALGGSPIQAVIERFAPVRDPWLRQRLAAAWIDHRVIALNNERAAAGRGEGVEAGPEGSITKLQSAELNQRVQELALDLEGVAGVAWEGRELAAESTLSFVGTDTHDPRAVARGFLRSQANTIEGGTSLIMRNILGERVLGLPKQPDPSRDVPWRAVPRSG